MRCSVFRTSRTRPVSSGGILVWALALSLAFGSLPAAAQQTGTVPPAAEAPKDTATPPPAAAAPSAEPAQTAPDSSAGAVQTDNAPFPDLTGVPTLVPMPRDPPEAQEVEIPAKPVVIVSGESSWDDSIVNLGNAFKKINAALEKAGQKPAGRPIAVFTKSTDDGFSFDAMIPLAEAPAADAAPLGDGIRYGTVPAGKALRFIHKDPYELISMTYEGVALYMENKNLVSKDELIEEYVTDLGDQSDKNTVVNIYVQLQDKK